MSIFRRAILALALIAGISPAIAQSPVAVPPLPDTERRVSYVLAASTCNCNIPFALFGEGVDYANWIEVWINGTRIDQLGNWSITIPVGTIGTVARPITNASLVFNAAQTGTVQIVGARRPRRISQFSESAGVSARNLNQAFTDIVAQNRETWDKINDVTGRVIMAPPGESLSVLASAASRANRVLGFDALGNIGLYSPASAVTGSDSVNFLQSGVSAISRTVQAELREAIKVTQFGAVCDGVTDDYNAIQAAIFEADRRGGAFVDVPTGRCRVNKTPFLNKWAPSGTLTVPGLKIRGQGKDATEIDVRGTNGFGIAINPEWKTAHKALFDAVTFTVGGTLGASGPIGTLGAITPGSLYTNGTYLAVPLTGGSGTGATANITIAGAVVTSVTLVNPGTGYAVGNALSVAAASVGGTGSGFSIPVATMNYYVQLTMTDPVSNEIFVTLPKVYSVTTITSQIAVTLGAVNNGYLFNFFCGTASTPVNECTLSSGSGRGIGGSQTVNVTAIGPARVVPADKIATWQNASVSDLSITSTTAAAGSGGISYFKAGYADITNVRVHDMPGTGLEITNYTGDFDGSFVVTVDKSKFQRIGGWCLDVAGNFLESSNFTITNSALDLCGTSPTGYTQPQNFASSGLTISAATNANPGVFTTSVSHNFSNNDQVWVRSIAGMTFSDGYYRVNLLTGTTFNLRTLDGNLIDTTAAGAYTPNSGRVMLAWRPPTTTTGSGGIRWMGLIGTFKNLGLTQVFNTGMYFTEGGASDNATIEAVDFENTYGKALYAASLQGGTMNNSECLSAASLGPTISCAQLGTGTTTGGVTNFNIKNIKVRSDVVNAIGFEQFRNTNFATPATDTNRISGVTWQAFSGPTRFNNFNFDPIPGQAAFRISALNTAMLIPVGAGGAMPMKLANTGEWITYQVPQTSVFLAGLSGTPSTQYYFYLYNSITNPLFPIVGAIEQSSGGPVLDASGYYVKSGDATRTYIGTATTNGAGQFTTTSIQSSRYPVTVASPLALGTDGTVSCPSCVLISGTGRGDANYTILSTDRYVYTNAGFTAPRTFTLPAANTLTAGTTIWVQDAQGTVGGTNTLTIQRGGADTINVATTSLVISNPGGGITFTSDGISNWGSPVQTVSTGGTGRATLTNNGVIVGAGTLPVSQTAAGTNGQLLLGATGAVPAFNTMSQDCTITAAGVTTCLRTNNVLFGNYATLSAGQLTNSIGANVALNNTGNYFDGPSVAQGVTGTWFASGTVTLADTGVAANIICKLWDGTTVIASGSITTSGAGPNLTMSLSGPLTTPAGNIKISCRDTTAVTGLILANASGNAKDSTVTVFRIN